MDRESWLGERAKLQSIVEDIESGLIRLAKGQDEYLETIRGRIEHLDAKIAGDIPPSEEASSFPS